MKSCSLFYNYTNHLKLNQTYFLIFFSLLKSRLFFLLVNKWTSYFNFQAVTVLIRNVKYHRLNSDQLKTLLLYAEEDCQNDERQANSFSLLKAILEAKLISNELHEVMEKVSKICILSESARSR